MVEVDCSGADFLGEVKYLGVDQLSRCEGKRLRNTSDVTEWNLGSPWGGDPQTYDPSRAPDPPSARFGAPPHRWRLHNCC